MSPSSGGESWDDDDYEVTSDDIVITLTIIAFLYLLWQIIFDKSSSRSRDQEEQPPNQGKDTCKDNKRKGMDFSFGLEVDDGPKEKSLKQIPYVSDPLYSGIGVRETLEVLGFFRAHRRRQREIVLNYNIRKKVVNPLYSLKAEKKFRRESESNQVALKVFQGRIPWEKILNHEITYYTLNTEFTECEVRRFFESNQQQIYEIMMEALLESITQGIRNEEKAQSLVTENTQARDEILEDVKVSAVESEEVQLDPAVEEETLRNEQEIFKVAMSSRQKRNRFYTNKINSKMKGEEDQHTVNLKRFEIYAEYPIMRTFGKIQREMSTTHLYLSHMFITKDIAEYG